MATEQAKTAEHPSSEEKASQAHHDATQKDKKERGEKAEDEESLSTILDVRQRTQLTLLLAAATATMRDAISDTFDASATMSSTSTSTSTGGPSSPPSSPSSRKKKSPLTEDEKIMNPDVDPGSVDVSAHDRERRMLAAREKELSAPRMRELRDAALEWFDAWREEVIGRVGEVVNSKREAREQIEGRETVARKEEAVHKKKEKSSGDDGSEATAATMTAEDRKIDKPRARAADGKDASAEKEKEEDDKAFREALERLCPPVATPLAELDESKRALILHSMLLLLLSLEHYPAPSRILLLHLVTSLRLPLSVLSEDERRTAQSLLQGAAAADGDEKGTDGDLAADKRPAAGAESQERRRWKVGLAAAAGAAVIGITGGMAAPLVAAGVGSVMGGLGLGATAAAGYLGAVAGSSVVVGGLFGAYGGRMTGQMMDRFAREVEDFAFIPMRAGAVTTIDEKDGALVEGEKDAAAAAATATADESSADDQKKKGENAGDEQKCEDETGKQDAGSRRLRVTIAISGWLTSPSEVASPWKVLRRDEESNSEVFALRWELEALLSLGNAITAMVSSAAWGYAKKELVAHTVFADLMAAMWPIGLLQVARVVDNPFSVAKARADKAGAVLADALIARAQGERPVTLVGYSLGARVIYACLLSLAARRAFGLVETAVLIGGPLPSEAGDWRAMRAAVSGRLVNVYSANDYVLAFLYRTSSVQLGVAGLQRVDASVAGVENFDVGPIVSGHLRYRYLVGAILRRVGLADDLDAREVEREADAFERMEEDERRRTEELKRKVPGIGFKVATGERGAAAIDAAQAAEAARGKTSSGAGASGGGRGDGGGGDDAGDEKQNAEEAEQEARQMEKHVQEKTQYWLMQRGAELLQYAKSSTVGDGSAATATATATAAEGAPEAGDKDDGGGNAAQQKGDGKSSSQSQSYSSYLTAARQHWPFTTNRSSSSSGGGGGSSGAAAVGDGAERAAAEKAEAVAPPPPPSSSSSSGGADGRGGPAASAAAGSAGRSYLEMAADTWRGTSLPFGRGPQSQSQSQSKVAEAEAKGE